MAAPQDKIFPASRQKRSDELEPLSFDVIESIIRTEIESAIDFTETEISQDRQLAESYYQGKTRLPTVKGRSNVVVTKVRDVIKSIQPSMARIFLQNRIVVEFEADEVEDEQIAQEQTTYSNRVFWRYGGYKAAMEAITDALKSRVGVVRVDYEEVEVASHQIKGVVSVAALQGISEDVEITEVSEPDEDGMVEVVATKIIMRPKWTVECLPPEQFFVDDQATEIGDNGDARIWGMRRNMRLYDIVAMGVPLDDLEGATMSNDSTLDFERFNRLGYDFDMNNPAEDKLSSEALVCEGYIRMDADGDGYAELRKFITVGDNHKLVLEEVVNYSKFCIFRTELYPHVFFPISVAEDVIQDQDAMTALLRSIIDNTALVNNPRTEINENAVNVEDAKNNRIGALIRVKQMGQIQELVTPFVAGQTLPVLQTLNDLSEARSGVTKLSQGVDADALQSTSRIAANGIQQAAEGRVEMMARNVAECGMKQLFYIIVKTAMHEIRKETNIKDETGQFKKMNPAYWHDQLGIWANVGLGNGRIDEKIMVLKEVAAQQQQAMMTLGLSNPVAGYEQYRVTMRDILHLAGIRNTSKYFPQLPKEVLAQIDQQMQQMKQQEGNSGKEQAMAIVQAEQIKAQAKVQTDMAKLQQQGQIDTAKIRQKGEMDEVQLKTKLGFDYTKLASEDDRERDQSYIDYILDANKQQLNENERAAIRIETNKDRTLKQGT